MLSGNSQAYSLILIIGAALPLFLLLTSIIILIKTKTAFVSQSSNIVELQQRIGTSLVIVVLLACLVLGIYMLLAPQSTMLLVLRLGILPGLILGIFLGRWALTMSVQIGLYGAIYSVLMSPLLIYLSIKAKLAGEKFYFMTWNVLFIPAIFLLLYGAYAFWIAQQTGTSMIGFWPTLMAALVTALIASNIAPLYTLIREIMSAPPKFSLARLAVLAQCYRYDCTVVVGLVLPLLMLALIGGLIGSMVIEAV